MNVRRAVVPVVCLLVAVGYVFGQNRVDATHLYARIYAIVPMIGTGTSVDPRRPMFTPIPTQMPPGIRTGIIAFNSVESDDGKFALIEIVAANKSELASITGPIQAQLSAVTGLQMFDRSTTSASTVQSAFQLLKKNFDITQFMVVVP